MKYIKECENNSCYNVQGIKPLYYINAYHEANSDMHQYNILRCEDCIEVFKFYWYDVEILKSYKETIQ